MFQRGLSTATPAFLILIIDQSYRMTEPFAEGTSKADYAAIQVNEVINELININIDGEKVKDRFFISLLGHSNGTFNEIRSDYLSSFADNPLRMEQLKKKVSDGAGGLIEIDEQRSIFIDPLATGIENELSAIEYSKELVEGWLNRKDYLSTAILNISGGYPKDWKEITSLINIIKDISSNNEKVVICNLLLESNKKLLELPTLEEVFNQSFSTKVYFEWSSYVNDGFIFMSRFGKKHELYQKMFFNQNVAQIVNTFNTGS